VASKVNTIIDLPFVVRNQKNTLVNECQSNRFNGTEWEAMKSQFATSTKIINLRYY